MPRNGSGVYSLPAGSSIANGDTSDATDLNTPLSDLETDMNTPRPVSTGGTGSSSASGALVNLGLTATAAEINVLDGIPGTLTATELGYVDGVTSAIQTQLDARQSLDADLTAIAAITRARGTVIRGGASAWEGLALATVGQVLFSDGTDVIYGSSINPRSVSASTSGTAIDFTGIPAWANEITVTLSQVSVSGTDSLDIRLGNSGGIVSSGYVGPYGSMIFGASVTTSAGSTGIPILIGDALQGVSAVITIRRLGPASTTWIVAYTGSRMTVSTGVGVASVTGGGELTISDLDRIRIRPFGANTFDNGNIGIAWQ
ncbi:MAG: hypothetical protein ACRC14_02685 [Paracoccaceae bacterium]